MKLSHKEQIRKLLEEKKEGFTMQDLVDRAPHLIHSCVKRIFDLRAEYAEKGVFIEYDNGGGNWYKSGYRLREVMIEDWDKLTEKIFADIKF